MDRCGGAAYQAARCRPFMNCVDASGLIDVEFTGPRFTWQQGTLKQWLDRALCNERWLKNYPRTITRPLERISSDHRPIVLMGEGGRDFRPGPKPFRFLAELQHWNWAVFGHIQRQKRKSAKLLLSAERENEAGANSEALERERSLRQDLEETLWQENLLWLQKSRAQWIVECDRNTRYYHLSTLKRRCFNRTQGHKSSDGVWVYDEVVLQKLARDFFYGPVPSRDGTLLPIADGVPGTDLNVVGQFGERDG
ncbi:unnamed protein product [Linum trigynum]|uniref:Uncharacterized protein n=1 Tax=Linum trigynum TaxID=586398 RepID=A0AAV2FSC6_9ROSI